MLMFEFPTIAIPIFAVVYFGIGLLLIKRWLPGFWEDSRRCGCYCHSSGDPSYCGECELGKHEIESSVGYVLFSCAMTLALWPIGVAFHLVQRVAGALLSAIERTDPLYKERRVEALKRDIARREAELGMNNHGGGKGYE